MSELHVRQIKNAILQRFSDHLNISDVKPASAEKIEQARLSRGQAALALVYSAGIGDEEAAAAVTDGFGDNGIDAACIHDGTLYLVQSKWNAKGQGTIERGELQKFLKGFRDFINARWSCFEGKARQQVEALEAALNDASTTIALLIVYTGSQTLPTSLEEDIYEIVSEINDPVEVVSVRTIRQSDLYAAVSDALGGKPVDVELALYDWGQVRDPFRGYYGQVAATDIAAWKANHSHRLFATNLRVFLGITGVNQDMVDTLLRAPEKFWYFNNGITALCRAVVKKPIGGTSKDSGFFECADLTIVNGAQTVGAIAAAAEKDPEQVSKARVAIRIISLVDCPPDFEKEVTRYTNTQNRIESRDFVALDPNQERLQSELRADGIDYVYKSGEVPTDRERGFDLVEATVARACAQEQVQLTVLAKGRIGKLWEDIEATPYKILFNPAVSGPELWRLVQIMRLVEQRLDAKRRESGRGKLLATHGNRFIVHLVYRMLDASSSDNGQPVLNAEDARVRKSTDAAFKAAHKVLEKRFSDNYLGSLFKNVGKCQELISQIKI